jgi:hypothetical protein
MQVHRLFVDVGLERVVFVRERWNLVGHLELLLAEAFFW